MLEALDTIHWSQTTSCYGKSEEIPIAIRGLISEDASVRSNALGSLWMSLEHQGTVYEASALAVPFLLAVLAHPDTQDKYKLIHFLAHLGCRGLYLGHWYRDLGTRIVSQKNREDYRFYTQEMRDRYRQWGDDTHRGFREGLPIFLSLLSDPDPTIREEIAFLLASFPEDRSTLLPPLLMRLQIETNEAVQCSLILCLGYILEPTLEASQLLWPYVEAEEAPLLRFAAARALSTCLEEQTPATVIHILFEMMIYSDMLQPLHEQLTPLWGSGRIHAKALYYLDILTSSPHQTMILERLIQLFPELDNPVESDCADLLLRVAFYEKQFHFQPGIMFEELSPLQQNILRTLEAKDSLWVGDEPQRIERLKISIPSIPCVGALAAVGFPTTRQGLRNFLAASNGQ